MKKFIYKHKILSSIILLPVLLVGLLVVYEFAGWPVGVILAQVDQARGSNRIKVIGMGDYTELHFNRLLDEKYKIKTDRVADCTVTSWEKGFWAGYNSVSKPAIKQKFGSNVFDECYRDAVLAKLKESDLPDEARRALESDLFFLEKRLQAQ